MRYPLSKNPADKQTEKQVRQLSGLAYIPTCRSPSPQTVYNTGRHRASGGVFLTLSATVGQVCRTGLTTERVTDFSIFGLGGLPLGRRSPKGEVTYYPPRSTILQNFRPIAQTVYEICVTKVFHFLALGGLTPVPKFTKRGDDRDLAASKISSLYANPGPRYPLQKIMRTHTHTHKQTVNDISPACLSACGDNNNIRHIPKAARPACAAQFGGLLRSLVQNPGS